MGHSDLHSERPIIRRHLVASPSSNLSPRPNLYWLWFGVFALTVALLGGSSRPDAVQAALLRPIAAMLLIPAFLWLQPMDLRRGKLVLLLLATLLVWMIAQLVPLPPSVWHTLPGRQTIAEIDQLVGLRDNWRPISFAPFRGLNSAFGLLIPLVALLLAIAMRISERMLLFAILAIGLIDAAFGLLQVIGGPKSPLYMFSFTNRGAPTGIFANENHSAVFSAIVLLVVTRLALESRSHNDPSWMRLSYSPAFIVILLSALITGSRAGFAATVAALLGSAVMALTVIQGAAHGRGRSREKPVWRDPRVLTLASCAISIILMVVVFLWRERSPAVSDIMNRDSFEDLRWSLWPILHDMAADHWLVGTGFGSFDAVYHIYEPAELLKPAYLNHAHNDWAQLSIEGGFPGVLLLLVLLGWIGRCVFVIGRTGRSRREQVIFWTTCIVVLAAAEIVDYPLRTPVFQASVVWLLICLSFDSTIARNAEG